MRHDYQENYCIPYDEISYLNKISLDPIYSNVYDDGNYVLYSSLLAIKPLAYDVDKYEKPRK